MMRPPTSATGSIEAHASSGFGRKAHSSTTISVADSPRAGSEAEGIDVIWLPLSNPIPNLTAIETRFVADPHPSVVERPPANLTAVEKPSVVDTPSVVEKPPLG